jgi:hypothetical protein
MTMPTIYRPAEIETMQACRQALARQREHSERERRNQSILADRKALHARETKAGDHMNAGEMITRARRALMRQIPDIDALADIAGERPEPFEKPKFGTPEYWLVYRVGWISEQDVVADKAQYDERRRTSLQTCHRPAAWPPEFRHHSNSRAYIPQMSAQIMNDPALTDGARRCAAKLMELIYRRNRDFRNLGLTVGYLAQCLGRSVRTVQNYLCELRTRGYIRHEVVRSHKARMCIGIFITLLEPIFPRHHRKEWPAQKNGAKPGVQKNSEKYLQFNKYTYFQERVSVARWTWKCMDGVFRAFMRTAPLAAAAGIAWQGEHVAGSAAICQP